MKLRKHRGSLADSMGTVVEISPTYSALLDEIRKSMPSTNVEITEGTVKVNPYGFDDRIGWDSHIVTVDGYGVHGFTDGPLQPTDTQPQ